MQQATRWWLTIWVLSTGSYAGGCNSSASSRVELPRARTSPLEPDLPRQNSVEVEDAKQSPAIATETAALSREGAASAEEKPVSPEEKKARDPETASRVSRHGIVWTFAKSRRIGRFINGDYWVVGPVKILEITPAPVDGLNGSVVNPVTGRVHGYDKRIRYFDSSLRAKLPLQLQPGDSLISTASLTEGNCRGDRVRDLSGQCITLNHAKMKTAAVLTVVDKPVTVGTFRPPYVGKDKPLYSATSIDMKSLPTLASVRAAPLFKEYLRHFERVWIQHVTDWVGRSTHPVENMLNYYREIAIVYSEVALLVLLEVEPRDVEARRELVIRLVQHGIDVYHTVLLGPGDSAVNKWPILFAGKMLGDQRMLGIFRDKRSMTPFREDWQTYYGKGWSGASVLWRQDPGLLEHEDKHPKTWAKLPSGGGRKRENYRHCCTSRTWVGMALSAKILDLDVYWNHPAYFDYVKRWMTDDFKTELLEIRRYYPALKSMARDAGSLFCFNMWRTYADQAGF